MRYADHTAEHDVIAAFYCFPFIMRTHRRFLNPFLFDHPDMKTLCALFSELSEKNISAGRATVAAALRDKGEDAERFGMILDDISKTCSITSSEVAGLGIQLEELGRARAAYEILGRVHGFDIVPHDYYLNAVMEAARLSRNTNTGCDSPINDICHEVINSMQTASESGGALLGPSTGFESLDKITAGLRRKTLWILGGRPAHGKSSVVLQVGDGVVRAGGRVLFISLEMPKEELVHRLVSQRTEIDGTRIQRATLNEGEWELVSRELASIAASGWIIIDRAAMTIEQIEDAIYAENDKEPLALVIVDYAQLIKHDAKEQRYRAIGRAAQNLFTTAKSIDAAAILVSQLNRGVEETPKSRPKLSDLRESGDLEQNAAFVLFVHRPALIGASVPKSDTELILRKNRYGPTGTIHAYMNCAATKFTEVSPDGEPTD